MQNGQYNFILIFILMPEKLVGSKDNQLPKMVECAFFYRCNACSVCFFLYIRFTVKRILHKPDLKKMAPIELNMFVFNGKLS